MADRNFQEMRTQGTGFVTVAFSFSPQGTSAPTLGEGCAGFVTSIVRNSAGNFTITLKDKYAALVAHHIGISMSAATDLKGQLGAVDVVTAKTVVLNVLAVSTGTDIAANAANKVSVTLILRNTSVTP